MRLVHVVPHIIEEASGPSYSVPRLCQVLAEHGQRVELMCLAARREIPGVRLSVYRQLDVMKRLAISPGLFSALRERAAHVDIVHNHSLWAMPNIAAGWAVPGRGARLVTSPRGTLSRWAMAHSKWVKRAVWPLQRRALFSADMLHATSEDEFVDIRRAGIRAPVVIVPNGIDIPESPIRRTRDGLRTLLFLGRLHPVKGIDVLLEAWRGIQGRHPQWRLVIAGRGEPAHVQAIHELARRLSLDRVDFPGPVYGEVKDNTYRNAEIFVLPSHTENFGMAVAEALSHGLPAVVSARAPWSGLVEKRCGWWVENTADVLARALDEAMALDPMVLVEKGSRGRDWMREEFGWDAVGSRMIEAYEWLVDGGRAPDCVRPAT